MCHAKRIEWLRAQLKGLTELQIEQKALLRQPHSTVPRVDVVQWETLDRSYRITALLQLLNQERNKLREQPKECAHQVSDQYAKGYVERLSEKISKELDEAAPHPKLYVVVDKALSPIQKGIQASHAIAQLFKRHGVLEHSSLVFLESANLSVDFNTLKQRVKAECFREPYWQNRLTAFALEPLAEEELPDLLKELQLAA